MARETARLFFILGMDEGTTFGETFPPIAVNLHLTFLHNCVHQVMGFGFSTCSLISISIPRCQALLTHTYFLASDLYTASRKLCFQCSFTCFLWTYALFLKSVFTWRLTIAVPLPCVFFCVPLLVLHVLFDMYADSVFIGLVGLASYSIQ